MFALLLALVGGVTAMIGIFCVIVLPPIIWRAFVMSKMWLWFAVPIFHVIPLGWVACIGVSAFIAMFTQNINTKELKENFVTNNALIVLASSSVPK